MTRPALMSLLALSLVLPARAFAGRCDDSIKKLASESGPAAKYALPAGRETWANDLQKDGPPCDDAVWRLVAAPGAIEKWNAAGTAQQQAVLLSQASAVLEKLDADVAALEGAAAKVYEAAAAANLIKANAQNDVKIKRAAFKTNQLTPNEAPTQFDGSDKDKAGALLAQRADAIAKLAVQPAAPKDAKPGAPAAPAKPGPLVTAYFTALEQVRKDVMAAASLGVAVPNVPPLIAPSTTLLSDNYRDSMKALAAAKSPKWDDQDPSGSAMDALQDRALRNRVAFNSANVEKVYQEAKNVAGSARAGLSFIGDQKKKDLDAMNAKLRAKVMDAIDYNGSKQAFDNEAARNGDYAQTAEGQYRAGELAKAKAAADSAQIVANGHGGYALQVDGKVVQGKDNIPDLKTAQAMLDKGELTSGVADQILAGHPLLAKTHAALEAAKGGASSAWGGDGAPVPMAGGKSAAGCDKDGEDLEAYKKRLRDEQMEKSAKASAGRQGPLKEYGDALKKIEEDYNQNLAGKMAPATAERIRNRDKDAAKQKYLAVTAAAGSMDDDIAARSANIASVEGAAEKQFVEAIKQAAPDLKTNMRGNLTKYVDKAQARVLLIDGGADDGDGTLFDQFIAEQWTWGQGALADNAQACKGTYRQGDYGSLEKCAGASLKKWLGARKQGEAKKDKSIDEQITETDRREQKK